VAEVDADEAAPDARLCAFLVARQEDIIAIWVDRVRALSPTREVSDRAIIDHLPDILTRISDVLASVHTGRPASLADAPTIHTIDRLARGFDLSDVIEEYALLRRTILDLWERDVAGTIALAEVRRLDLAIDQAIEQASVRFANTRQRTLKALDRISEAALGTEDLDSFLRQLLQATLESTEAVDTGMVLLREDDVLRARAAVGLEKELDHRFTIKIGEGFAGKVAAEGKRLFLRHASAEPTIKSQIIHARGVRALYGVPLAHDGHVVGVAYIGSRTAFEFSEEDKLLFRTMASRATGVIVQTQAHDQADRVARQLAERELEFRTLADNIAQLAWMADEKGFIFWYNNRWLEYTGSTLEEMQGAGWQDVHHPEHLKRAADKLRRSFEMGETWEDTLPLRAWDGVYRWFLSRAIPVRDDDGRIVRWFGTHTDVTEERKAVQLREEVLAIVSHDLRNPLGAIRMSGSLLARKLLSKSADAAMKKHVETIQRAAGRMDHLIADLLDVASIQAGRLAVDAGKENVAAIIDEAVELQSPLAVEKGIVLSAQLDAVRTIDVHVDRARLLQVFGNLLGNAIKFCQSGDRIAVGAEAKANEIVFSVSDTGPGIAGKDLPRIFEPYWSAQRHARKGTGLGLHICKGIVEAHRGRIWVESKVGDGSTFFFTVPVSGPVTH
jgi:PAS domain S-box-containing protein